MPPRDQSDEPDEPERRRKTHREHKEEVRGFSDLALALIDLKRYQLEAVPLSPEALEAVLLCQTLRKTARARHLRLIATLLRHIDAEAVERAVADVLGKQRAHTAKEKAYDQWRTRLLREGDAALTAFVAQYPHADAQQFRQLMRQAARADARGKAAFRQLFACIRDALEHSP